MSSEIGQRDHYALLINPSAEPRHLEKTELGLGVLSAAGYETFVASPVSPAQPVDHYVTSTIDNVRELIANLKGKIDADDELVIYTTGHGAMPGKVAPLCFEKKCYDFSKTLDGIQYGQRVVVMDQCYGGSWGSIFLDDPGTLFISASGPGEMAFADFPYPFWSQSVADFDDGIDWQGRFGNAVESGMYYSLPQFIPSPDFTHPGTPPFEAEAREVANKKGLNKALDELEPGQYAAVLFSDDSCGVSTFDEQAAANGGQHLWLRTNNKKLAKGYGVKDFPAVMIVDANGHTNMASEGMAVEEAIAQFHIAPKEIAFEMIAAAEAIDDPWECANKLGILAMIFTKRDLYGSAVPVFEELIRVAMGIKGGTWDRTDALESISSHLTDASFKKEEIAAIFEDLKEAAGGIKDRELRAETLHHVALDLARAGFTEEAVSVFEKSIKTAEKIKDARNREVELRIMISRTDYALFEEEALKAIEISIEAALKIKDDKQRSLIEEKLSFHITEAGLEGQIELSLS